MYDPSQELTNISWCTTGCGHHTMLQCLRQPKVTDHDLRILICVVVQQVLWLLTDTEEEKGIE